MTDGLEIRCSIQLSYEGKSALFPKSRGFVFHRISVSFSTFLHQSSAPADGYELAGAGQR